MTHTALPPLKAVLFDLDGLLADTEPIQKRAFEEVCRRYLGPDFAITDALHASFVGKSDFENAEELIERYAMPVTPERLVREREDLYVEMLRRGGVRPMPGVPETIDRAREVGLRLAVGSSSIRRFVVASLEGLFATIEMQQSPEDVFGTIVCGDDPRIRDRKPAPDIYLRCAEDLGVLPEECLVLEDSGSGIESARRAGIIRAVAVPNVYTRGHDFTKAYRVLASVDEVLRLDDFPSV